MTFTLADTQIPPGKASLRTIDLKGRAGRLEALLNEGSPASRFAALVCHPHPLGGGTMHNKVVYHATKVLNAPEWGFELPVLRFNFRGTGRSDGQHDGRAESDDVTAALHWLHSEYNRPVVLAGFSFGAAMAIAASCGSSSAPPAKIHALAVLGLPTQASASRFAYPAIATCSLPKLFLSGDLDGFAPKEDLQRVAQTAADPTTLVLIPGADHFFTGRLELMQNALSGWLKEQVA
jgi:alpha/beta superfamily hydrolase